MNDLIRYQNTDSNRAYWRGYYRGKKAVRVSILRYVQIMIVVTATIIIFRGCDVLVTLQ